MIGINVPIPVPMAYYSFGGWKASLFGDTHAHGAEGVHFFTRGKAITTRWLDPSHGGLEPRLPPKQLSGRRHDHSSTIAPTTRRCPTAWTSTTLVAEAARAYELDRAHVFHSWSAQAADQADDDRGVRGLLHLGRRRTTACSTSPLSWSSPTSATSTRRSSRPSRSRPAKLCTIAPQHANDARSEAARLIARAHPRRPEQDLLHQRRRRRQRARRAHGATAHRPLQGADAVPLLPRRHRHRDQPDR